MTSHEFAQRLLAGPDLPIKCVKIEKDIGWVKASYEEPMADHRKDLEEEFIVIQ